MTAILLSTGERINITRDMSLKCAIGNFDGVHLGHAELIKRASQKEPGITHSAVWTFISTPRVSGKAFGARVLTSTEQKLELFKKLGADIAILCDFGYVRDMSPELFVNNILINECNIKSLVCGFNFRFGAGARGDTETLRGLLKSKNASLTVVPEVTLNGKTVSSSLIRDYIEAGDMESADEALGHPYEIRLPVTQGHHIGRTIGVPTVNQVFPENYAIPRHGVYSCVCTVNGVNYPAVANVGVRPTVSEHAENVNCETHIIGYSGDLYGVTVPVRFYKFLRGEEKFPSLDSLKKAININISDTAAFFENRDLSLL